MCACCGRSAPVPTTGGTGHRTKRSRHRRAAWSGVQHLGFRADNDRPGAPDSFRPPVPLLRPPSRHRNSPKSASFPVTGGMELLAEAGDSSRPARPGVSRIAESAVE